MSIIISYLELAGIWFLIMLIITGGATKLETKMNPWICILMNAILWPFSFWCATKSLFKILNSK